MIQAVFYRGNLLRKVARAIQHIVNRIHLDCNSDRLRIAARNYDPVHSNVVVAILTLPQANFTTYICPEAVTFSTEISIFLKAFVNTLDTSVIEMNHQDGSDQVHFTITNPVGGFLSEFTNKNFPMNPIGAPSEDFTTTINMPSAELGKVVGKTARAIGRLVRITVTNERIDFQVVKPYQTGFFPTGFFPTNAAGSVTVHPPVPDPLVIILRLKCLEFIENAKAISRRVLVSVGGDYAIFEYVAPGPGVGSMKYYVRAV